MPIIVATEEGIEVDGITLSNTWELQAFITAHSPDSINVSLKIHPPEQLQAQVKIHEPEAVNIYIGANQPEPLPVDLGAHDPRHLYVLLKPINFFDLQVYINGTTPFNLNTTIGGHNPSDLQASLSLHLPKDFSVNFYGVPYHKLEVVIDWMIHHEYLSAVVKSHPPWPLNAVIDSHLPKDITVYIRPAHLHSFAPWFIILKEGLLDISVALKGVIPGTLDLNIYMHIWSIHDLNIGIASHPYDTLSVLTHVWTPADMSTMLSIHFPQKIDVDIYAEPEAGSDLIVYHGFNQISEFFVEFDTWDYWNSLSVQLYGYYESFMSVVFTMGGYETFIVELPGMSGYENLFVTIRPASRIMSTIIPIYTMEMKDLWVSINQGWPCGFYSTYALLEVLAGTAYLHPLELIMTIIDGSGYGNFAVYLNKMYFSAYFDTFDINVYIPDEILRPESVIPDSTEIVYDNEFSDLYQEVLHVTFPWPRFKLLTGSYSFSVELYPFHGDKVYSLEILLIANRQDPPVMPTSQPLQVKTDGYGDPEWPDVFQVKEIELWSMDPPELVRRIEVMFDEQVKEYYWVSQEQKAMSKSLYERWAFLTRGYLPHTEYSGQIEYETLRTLSSMKRYSSIDEAVRAMITGFLYNDLKPLTVYLNVSGGYNNLRIVMDVWGRDRLRNLNISIWPVRTSDLSVTIQAT